MMLMLILPIFYAVCYIMYQNGFCAIGYIDNYVGLDVLKVEHLLQLPFPAEVSSSKY